MFMNENNMLYFEEIREKLGVSPKKCIYQISKGEAVISKICEQQLHTA